ncbi:hypothetical protein SARC_18055, partial [Sphaeroforma arctica JP610]
VKVDGEVTDPSGEMIRELESQRERNIKREIVLAKQAGEPFGVEVIVFQVCTNR